MNDLLWRTSFKNINSCAEKRLYQPPAPTRTCDMLSASYVDGSLRTVNNHETLDASSVRQLKRLALPHFGLLL